MHVYIYMYVCVYIYVYIHTYMYLSLSLSLCSFRDKYTYISRVVQRGGGLGSRPKNMYGERLGDGVEYNLMKSTPRR